MNIELSLASYFSTRQEVVAAFLFGSYAFDRQRPESDLDIGILLAFGAVSSASALRTIYTVELGAALRKDIHPVIMNLAGEELLRRIFAKGKCLQINDQRALDLFRIAAYGRIADFERYRKMTQRGFIRRLKSEIGDG